MKIKIPKVVRPIRLSDYAPEFGDQEIGMWVNPSRDKRLEFVGITERARDTRALMAALVADERSIEQLTKDSQEAKKEHERQFAHNVLAIIEAVKDLDDDERAERLAEAVGCIKEQGVEIHAWYAEMWSQGDGEKWTGEEVKELAEAAINTDPGLWDFLQESSLDAMSEYRTRKKSD